MPKIYYYRRRQFFQAIGYSLSDRELIIFDLTVNPFSLMQCTIFTAYFPDVPFFSLRPKLIAPQSFVSLASTIEVVKELSDLSQISLELIGQILTNIGFQVETKKFDFP